MDLTSKLEQGKYITIDFSWYKSTRLYNHLKERFKSMRKKCRNLVYCDETTFKEELLDLF